MIYSTDFAQGRTKLKFTGPRARAVYVQSSNASRPRIINNTSMGGPPPMVGFGTGTASGDPDSRGVTRFHVATRLTTYFRRTQLGLATRGHMRGRHPAPRGAGTAGLRFFESFRATPSRSAAAPATAAATNARRGRSLSVTISLVRGPHIAKDRSPGAHE